MKLTDGSEEWWHCPTCGFELQREIAPNSCSLCKAKNEFAKGRYKTKKGRGSYDDVLDELKKYEEGCDPLTTKSGYAEE